VPLTGKFTLEFILAFQTKKVMPHRFDKNFVVKLNNVAANIIFLQLNIINDFMVEGFVIWVDGLISS
jgi:hypothetical protein